MILKISENLRLLASAKSALLFTHCVLETQIWRMPLANADKNGFSNSKLNRIRYLLSKLIFI